jgi:hypothetical protein
VVHFSAEIWCTFHLLFATVSSAPLCMWRRYMKGKRSMNINTLPPSDRLKKNRRLMKSWSYRHTR